MTAIAFDTLKFTKHLTQAGASRELAEATAEAFKEAAGEAEIATKGDLSQLEQTSKSDLSQLEQNIKTEFTRMNGEIRLIKWMLTLLLAGVMSLVFKSFLA
uniref:DUF1640 domain-containing protein n=2 Tax=unclassified Candidatus Kentrum TaxID=2643149 RepID=A0A451ANL9_9GAMM|nr:MAG: hypothetical protein BECKLPF1236A_GA0070988_1005214 [Candidatus Kentron sp. LPFa]VFK29959.1 MAG: hypothetical protein BECKLPF1236C_GA0070990_100999 [Candidatus Kentron sp. LPFa]VFK67622.1 MAG: hypothetical protein BECKUNK1418G_GA0071005_11523 [Candidatus Kentron sp. UNK]VFK72851.1 MAG: hypothetical protein BECKUNK1418H_GA0071006_11443 [Candidatus Kentron sp. UNK]